MRELFRKYLDNKCSANEVRQLFAFFKIAENEMLLRRLITEWLEENDEEEYENQWRANFYKALVLMKEQLIFETLKVIHIVRQTWFQEAATLSIIILPVVFTAQSVPLD